MRHSHAVPEGPALVDDHRYLTDKGRDVARAVAQKLKEKSVQLDAIVTSPLVRAVQTAELMAQGLSPGLGVQASSPLTPGIPPQVIAGRLATYGSAVLVVGHEPGISMLGAVLVGRPSFPPFRPGQVSALEDGRPLWTLPSDTLEFDQLLIA